jgi:membrane fusion protein
LYAFAFRFKCNWHSSSFAQVAPVFRTEATTKHRNRLSGDVAIAVPVPWQSIGFLIFGSVALGVLFLSFATYSRVETVTGIITPNTGVSNIVPTRVGMIASLAVRDGQNVPAGAALATIRAEEDGAAAQPLRLFPWLRSISRVQVHSKD